MKQLVKLERGPDYVNFEGYSKLYADRKRIRIVYGVNDFVIRVVAIDKREDLEVLPDSVKKDSGTRIRVGGIAFPAVDLFHLLSPAN